jgi:hypothetical protein
MKFATRVAIQQGVEVRDAAGGVSYTHADVQGLESLPATVMPYTDENRQERYTEAEQHYNIVLQGHHPEITTSMWVLAYGERYEIERVATTKLHKVSTLTARRPSI